MACYDFSADYCIIYRHCLCFSHFQDYAIFNWIATNACGENMLSGNWIIIASIVFFQCETPHTWTDNEFEPHTYTQLEMVGDNTNWIRKSLPPPPLRCVSINRSANFPVPGRTDRRTLILVQIPSVVRPYRQKWKAHVRHSNIHTSKPKAAQQIRLTQGVADGPKSRKVSMGRVWKPPREGAWLRNVLYGVIKKKQKIARSEKEAGAGDA